MGYGTMSSANDPTSNTSLKMWNSIPRSTKSHSISTECTKKLQPVISAAGRK